ncbi:MAG: NADH-quinone oxidoreductase subunit L [Abitibacteriaceae bacterium]|nr:NADH-quinone oxidoreductase subunit L [Abditibacteriaceae bacterium]
MPLFLIVLFPLLGFAVNGLIGKRLPKPIPGAIACLAVLASFVVALLRFFDLASRPENARAINETVYNWMSAGSFKVDVSFLFDQLSAIMILIVTGVGFLIHLYSVGYMADDHNDPQGTLYARYFTFLNLFIAFMSVLVLADNYLLMFVGWEGVGLCSYFLIGYWFQLDEAAEASKKAFIVNRIGDFGFLLGMMLMFLAVGSLKYADVFAAASTKLGVPASNIAGLAGFGGVTLVTVITLLLTVGATGKSAQIPLYVWLPDAMAGPTPVSALIHAATMVTAGIYMVARSAVLFELSPATKLLICGIGALTALAAGLTALAHNDIKKVLAYSTVSQLGFMFMAVGAGAYVAAIFHVFTHAFFKACLFLGAGSVIHALHGEQDMRKMGGLATKMKATHITFLLAGLALAAFPLTSGFFSKDEIIAQVFNAGSQNSLYTIFGGVGLLTAVITALYTGRQYAQVFLGESRFAHATDGHSAPALSEVEGAHETHEGQVTHEVHEAPATADAHGAHSTGEVHESPTIMTLPLWILAVGAIFAGYLGVPHIPGVPAQLHGFATWLDPLFPRAAGAAESSVNWVLLGLGVLIGAGGWIVGRTMGINADRALLPDSAANLSLDKIYNQTVVAGGFALTSALRWVDDNVIDGIVRGVGTVIMLISGILRLTQTSYVRNYALGMALGAAVIIGYFMVR